MPACNKVLSVHAKIADGNDPHIEVKCVYGEGHEGEHEWHVWTTAYNKVMGYQGVVKVFHGDI